MAKRIAKYVKLTGLPEPEKKDFWALFRDSQAERSLSPEVQAPSKSTGESDGRAYPHRTSKRS